MARTHSDEEVDVLVVGNLNELFALNRALMETRFLADGVDAATRGSADLAHLHERVVESIKSSLISGGDTVGAARWVEWQQLERRVRELPAIVAYLETVWDLPLDDVSKRQAVENQLKPFSYPQEKLSELIRQLNSKR
ncbi:hypothetical protein [Micromonospora maritima]|uniref:Uncharacterized protein n=1 Tax=Micromonospora maritima TaxID=986711 RepID=A0ABW7ZQ41_9ACTN